MIDASISGWNSRLSTPLKRIKAGDVAMFQIDDSRYGVAIVMARVDLGHVVEIFSCSFKKYEVVDSEFLSGSNRIAPPVIIDSYSLIDKKLEGNWQIVGRINNYTPNGLNDLKFKYGAEETGCVTLIDIFGNEQVVNAKQAENIPYYSPKGDEDIKELFI